ncbi:MAG TPA: hypothetical protein VNM39_13235 [Verrucomicrobiae bacterium]|nr:hypothetical protein [Verrucomicrobiae bacterium]
MNLISKIRIAWHAAAVETRDYWLTTRAMLGTLPAEFTFTPERAVQIFRGIALKPIGGLCAPVHVTSIKVGGVEQLCAPVPWELFAGVCSNLFAPIRMRAGDVIQVEIDPGGRACTFTVMAKFRAVNELAFWPHVRAAWRYFWALSRPLGDWDL